MHEIVYAKPARRALLRMPVKLRQAVEKKIRRLAEVPYAPGANVKKLQGRQGYRLRVGDWRVLYIVDDAAITILVLDVLPRGGAYKP